MQDEKEGANLREGWSSRAMDLLLFGFSRGPRGASIKG